MRYTARVLPWAVAALLMLGAGRGEAIERVFQSELPLPLGVQIDPETVTDEDLRQLREVGFDFVRFGIRPRVAQRTAVPVDYPRLTARLRAHGLQSLGTLFGGAGIWGPASAVVTDPDQRFAEFAAEVLGNDAIQVTAFELWNEPELKTFLNPARQDEFEQAMRLTCERLGQVPRRPVLAGFGFARFPFDERNARLQDLAFQLLKTGCLQELSVHPYRNQPESVIGDYRQLAASADERGIPRLTILASEWGYASVLPRRSQHAQAQLLVRTYLSNIAADIAALNLYAWRDRGTNPLEREDNFGLVDYWGQPKEAFRALRDTLQVLRGYRLSSYRQQGQLHRLVLSNGKGLLYLYWTNGGAASLPSDDVPGEACEMLYLGTTSQFSDCPPAGGLGRLVDSRPLAQRMKP
ncbi:hypothetical protein [Pseudomonas oryzihabitans]|uniref:hypothetical protein n=1 Tax=Pseudomonas oryzihabitans TaxID=47885 RepID=UPI00111EB349|nr:hypothetical protein [Pseudomonas psychrotolerans]